MPRPKRSKVAPSAPISLHRVAQPVLTASAAQQQKDIFSPASSGRVTNGSDDSDRLVVSKKTASKGKIALSQEYVMSGALAPEDIGSTRLKPPSSKTRAALNRVAREADHARAAENARARRAAQQTATEPEQIPSSFPEGSLTVGEFAVVSIQPPARKSSQITVASKFQETPRLQSSMLGGATFKKRPRQPSLLQMVQKQNQIHDELDDDDMYNFLPDDESTPLIKSLSQPHAHTASSSSRHTSGSRKRKQVTPEIQVPASQSQSDYPRSSPSSFPSPPLEQVAIFDLPGETDEPQPTLPRHRSTETSQPQTFSDTLAPPQSSSPAKAQQRAAPRNPPKSSNKSKSKTQQPQRKEPSPAPSPMSPISTQISPVRRKPLKTLTTATLQNLLPRRRVRGKPKGDFDIPSSSDVELDNTGLGEDEDELSFHTTKVRRKKPSMTGQKSAPKRKQSLAAKRVSKTYTRKSIVASKDEDDENESASGGEERENAATGRKKTPALDGKAKAEMKRLADKFKEVDGFMLEFEDMTGSSSQMKDAR